MHMLTPYDAIVAGIINLLQPPPANPVANPPVPAPWWKVEAMPDQMAKWANSYDMPTLTVVYAESRFGNPQQLGIITQVETAIFDVYARGLKLNGSRGVYALMGEARARLIGKRAHKSGEQLYLQDQQRVALAETNEHIYVMRWACRIPVSGIQTDPEPNIADPTDKVLGPALQQVTLNQTLG